MTEQTSSAQFQNAVTGQKKVVVRIKNVVEAIAPLRQDLNDCEVQHQA